MTATGNARALHRATVGAHVTLACLVIACVVTAPWPIVPRLAVAVAAALPFALAWRGLIRAQRRTCQWLAVVLVLYSGAAVVEVVASAGRAYLAALVLLAALVELGLTLVLSRSLRPTARLE